eukprot:GSChrysophyteH1.ASY1.ANO1.2309.1 assembled CDS
MLEEGIAEAEHMLRGLHPKMKAWYALNRSFLSANYGDFPNFWQDLGKWADFPILKKTYLIFLERCEAGQQPEEIDLKQCEIAAKNNLQMQQQSKEENDPNSTMQVKRKRRKFTSGSREPPLKTTENTMEPLAATAASADGVYCESNVTGQLGQLASDAEAKPAARTRGRPREKRSRWSTNLHGSLPHVPGLLQLQLNKIAQRLPGLAAEALLAEQDPDRSPSPPPVMKEKLLKERDAIIDQISKINEAYVAPADYVKRKPSSKIFVPVKEHPTYNFIGLILGPRGNTQKQMEQATGCRISIRGKGSMRDGSRGRISRDMQDAEQEDLHVFVQGESQEGVEEAERMVRELLKPLEDSDNDHKMRQLRELAVINNTLREDDYCHICGERGHRQYECPQRTQTSAGIKCAICGDLSHPTRDCPQAKHGMSTGQVDVAYTDFIAELSDPNREAVLTDAQSTIRSSYKSEQKDTFGDASYEERMNQLNSAPNRRAVAHAPTQAVAHAPTQAVAHAPTQPMAANIPDYAYYGDISSGYNQQYASYQGNWDAEWAEYYRQNPEAYMQYQTANAYASANYVPPPPPPPPH